MKKNRNPYQDVLVIVTGFLVIFLLVKNPVFLYVAAGVALASVFSEFLTQKITWGWERLALGLGYISSRVLLSLVFFLLLTPLAFLYRMRSRDVLQLKRKNSGSYFTERGHLYVRKDLERMW
ncbi:MAG TPA: SxtJ family membrane protein [Chitinophagales bacterium]|nr:SxtJ family membrane protein [Chitinophagales bacterium]